MPKVQLKFISDTPFKTAALMCSTKTAMTSVFRRATDTKPSASKTTTEM